MTLEKAIELAKEAKVSLRKHKFIDHADAVQLCIEAAKVVIALRDQEFYPASYLLPGETK